jgi:hypothetical protein
MIKHLEKRVCFYCDAVYVVSGSSLGDHFPIPKRYGGEITVPCCRECHSLKDRISIGEWNLQMAQKVISDFPKLSRESRIFLAKLMNVVLDLNLDAVAPGSVQP